MNGRGFTLVELLITIAVAAIMVSYALPSFQGLLTAERGRAALNQMVGAVALTRSQAIISGSVVSLCPASAGRCLGRNQWHRGAMVFVDENANGDLDGDDLLIRALPPLRDGERVYWRSFRNRSYLQFRPRGYTRWQNGNFLYCPPGNDPMHARMVILNVAGRARVARDLDGNGVVDNANGDDVSCPP